MDDTDNTEQMTDAALEGVIFFIDVRSDSGEDTSAKFVEQLTDLGATRSATLTGRVTHVVLKDPSQATLTSLTKLTARKDIYCVTCHWVQACYTSQAAADPEAYAVDLANITPTKVRSQKPKPVDESVQLAKQKKKGINLRKSRRGSDRGSASRSPSTSPSSKSRATKSPTSKSPASKTPPAKSPRSTARARTSASKSPKSPLVRGSKSSPIERATKRAESPIPFVPETLMDEMDASDDDGGNEDVVPDTPEQVDNRTASRSKKMGGRTVVETQLFDLEGSDDEDNGDGPADEHPHKNPPATTEQHDDDDDFVARKPTETKPAATAKPKPLKSGRTKASRAAFQDVANSPVQESRSGVSKAAKAKKSTAKVKPARSTATKTAAKGGSAKTAAKTKATSVHKAPPSKKVFALSSLHRGERDTVAQAVKFLGGVVTSKVTSTTTHVISGGGRTLKVLEGIARGLWIVEPSFALASLAMEGWCDESEHEITHFPACAQQRELREQWRVRHSSPFQSTILKGSRLYIPDRELAAEVAHLIKLCGGALASGGDTAKVVMANEFQPRFSHKKQASLRWLFDSIAEGEAMCMDSYILAA